MQMHIRVRSSAAGLFGSAMIASWFRNEDPAVRRSAYIGFGKITIVVLAQVAILATQSWQINHIYHTYSDIGDYQLFLIELLLLCTIQFGFALLDSALFPLLLRYAWDWREESTCWRLDRLHALSACGTADMEISQKLTDSIKGIILAFLDLYPMILRALATLIVFGTILWKLSDEFHIGFLTPWRLVVLTAIASLLQTAISIYLGRNLRDLQNNATSNEAMLRRYFEALERKMNESHPELAEHVEHGRLNMKGHVRNQMRTAYLSTFRDQAILNAWKVLSTQFWSLTPYILMGAFLAWDLNKNVSLGTLMQVAWALVAVHGSLAVMSDAWAKVTEFQMYKHRLDTLEVTLSS